MPTPRIAHSLAAICLVLAAPAQAICTSDIVGGWEGRIAAAPLFTVDIEMRVGQDGGLMATVASGARRETVPVWRDGAALRFQPEGLQLAFDGRFSDDDAAIRGFVTYASHLHRMTLTADDDGVWTTRWQPIPAVTDPVALELYFDDDEGSVNGYFFFRDERLPGLYGYGTRCDGRHVNVGELNLGLEFDGEFDADFSRLTMTVTGPAGVTDIEFRPMSAERREQSPGTSERPPLTPREAIFTGVAPMATDDGWRTDTAASAGIRPEPLAAMLEAVAAGELPRAHGVLVARGGKLVVEEYFYGYDRDTLHDMRSASKSVTAALTGLAIDRGMLPGADAEVLPLLPGYRLLANWSPEKADIRIRDLLTMSSGLDANDSDRTSVASENAYQSQVRQPDWIRLALDAPMIATPGTRVIYGSANPMILGGVLAKVVGDRVEWFADEALFAPLGIERYRIFMDPTGVPYMGGGMYLRPRDMLKFGQLHLDGGRWQGRQVLSEDWVQASFGRYGRLEPLDRNGNEYGYLWWHETYDVGGRQIASVEARGNGGQYIFVVPELDLVAVITAGNYRGGLETTRQSQRMFERYVLPAVVQ